MNVSSEISNLELLVFYLTKAVNPSLKILENVRLADKDKKNFKIIDLQNRPLNPLLTVIDDFGIKKLYSAENLKAPYWVDCDLPQEVIKLLNDFHSSYLADEQKILDEQKQKQQKLFLAKLESALSKHKKILEDHSIDFKGVSILEREYSSHCYKCKEPVSSKSNYMCNTCNTLICNKCGNCKCLFVDLKS